MARKILVNKDGVPVKWWTEPVREDEQKDFLLLFLIVPVVITAAGILLYVFGILK